MRLLFISSSLIGLLSTQLAFAQDFVTDTNAPTIIELYTSEGCSSCPPADRFL